jgi:hypothetical protein
MAVQLTHASPARPARPGALIYFSIFFLKLEKKLKPGKYTMGRHAHPRGRSAPPPLGAVRRLRGGALGDVLRGDADVLASLARAIDTDAGAGGAAKFAQDSGAAFLRINAGAATPYVAAELGGADAFSRTAALRDLQLTSLLVLVGAALRYKVVWRAGAGKPVRPQMLRTLTALLVANALRVLIVNLFVPLSAAARVAFHADADWWFGKGGAVVQTASDAASGLDVGRGLRKMGMTWFFTSGIADLINEAPPAIRDVYVAATR